MLATTSRSNERVICLIDMDCFYVQVEELECPQYQGKPCGVSQYNPYKGGGLIAVNYEARKFGVKRGMRGEQAKALCPEFHAFFVQEKRGKANLTKYRDASLKIFEIISSHCEFVEKASIDEAYIDLTDKVLERIRTQSIQNIDVKDFNDSYVVGSYALNNDQDRETNLDAWMSPYKSLTSGESNEFMLIVGALIVKEIRDDIFKKLGYRCSAGIANNKTLAKLCCGLNKPNKQTILPLNATEALLDKTHIQKIKNLGGKLGIILNEELKLNTVGDLSRISLNDLVRRFGDKTGNWLHQISHGIDVELVMSRQSAKSIGCSKNFRGKQALDKIKKVDHWVTQLCDEMEERLESDRKIVIYPKYCDENSCAKNQREPNLLVVHITNEAGTFSKSTSINKCCAKRFKAQTLELINGFNKASNKDDWIPFIYTLGVSATKFVELDKNKSSNMLLKYFSNSAKTNEVSNQVEETEEKENRENPSETSASSLKEGDNLVKDLDSSLLAVMDAINRSISSNSNEETNSETNSKINNSEVDTNSEENSSKRPMHQDIKSLLKNQKKSKIKDNNDSDEDADILIDDNQFEGTLKTTKSLDKISDYLNKVPDDLIIEDVDYVMCEQCKKKILCWNMPEHEDFHFAQKVSKQMSSDISEQANLKKRSIDEVQASSSSNKKNQDIQILNVKKGTNKKLKVDSSESFSNGVSSNKSNVKPIENYFKKINKK